jgi:hypothetical protein
VGIVNNLRKRGLWAAPGHYLSPLPSRYDIDRQVAWDAVEDLPGINMREPEQLSLASKLNLRLGGWDRYKPDNPMYGEPDAALYRALLEHETPRKVVEVGSGWSTAVALDCGVAVTSIEPFPVRMSQATRPDDPVTLVERPVQDVPVDQLTDLAPGDILFIDSSHVAKAGSDVQWLVLNVLPCLSPGVRVHVHDIFWPFSYPEAWLREGRAWNESYLLRALLTDSPRWRIDLFAHWLWAREPSLQLPGPWPSGLWLRRT